jgi:hypothetical protein
METSSVMSSSSFHMNIYNSKNVHSQFVDDMGLGHVSQCRGGILCPIRIITLGPCEFIIFLPCSHIIHILYIMSEDGGGKMTLELHIFTSSILVEPKAWIIGLEILKASS